jgi:hypothetical protein
VTEEAEKVVALSGLEFLGSVTCRAETLEWLEVDGFFYTIPPELFL